SAAPVTDSKTTERRRLWIARFPLAVILKLKESRPASDTDIGEFVPAGQKAALPLPVRSFRTFLVFAIVAGTVALLFWLWRVSGRVPSLPREPKATQLTATSFETPVTRSAISPDGKYLAFTDNARRIRVRLQATGETQSIPEPEALQSHSVDWAIAAWFPDSTRFIANAKPTGSIPWCSFRWRFAAGPSRTGSTETQIGEPESIWIVSVLGKAPQKLRDDAHAFSVSPDGSLIAFGTNPTDLGDREIWLMDGGGFQPRKLYDAPEKTVIGDLH